MPRTISDEEDQYLQGRRQVADFVESIYNDPSLAREAKSLIKKKYPNLQIPDYDLETKMDQRFEAERKERSEAEEKKRQREEDERFQKSRSDTQKKFELTDDAMGRLEQLMLDRNIGVYEAAAMLMVSKEPKPAGNEGDWDSTRWHHEQREGFADIAKDPEAWGRTQIMGAIQRDMNRARNGG